MLTDVFQTMVSISAKCVGFFCCFFFPKAVHLEEMAETTTDMLIQRPEESTNEHSPEKVNMQSE